jgi:hypothetical protein
VPSHHRRLLFPTQTSTDHPTKNLHLQLEEIPFSTSIESIRNTTIRESFPFFTTGNSKSKGSTATPAAAAAAGHRRQPSSPKQVRKSLTQDISTVKGVNQMAVQRDYNKPLQEEEPYLVQVPNPNDPLSQEADI